MGRWSYSYKIEADGLKKINTRFLKKHGYFEGWRSGTITWTSGYSENKSSISIQVSILEGHGYMRLIYTQTDRESDEKKDFDYQVQLTTTPCEFGGKRYWFICPLTKNNRTCGRRVGTLYKAGDYFGCRHCYDLTYSSKKVNRAWKYGYLAKLLDIEDKISRTRETMKRAFYAGRPTRKLRRIMRLDRSAEPYQTILLNNEGRGIL
jgi:hypothetical protein